MGLMALMFSVLAEVAIIHGDLDKAREYSEQASDGRVGAYGIFGIIIVVATVFYAVF